MGISLAVMTAASAVRTSSKGSHKRGEIAIRSSFAGTFVQQCSEGGQGHQVAQVARGFSASAPWHTWCAGLWSGSCIEHPMAGLAWGHRRHWSSPEWVGMGSWVHKHKPEQSLRAPLGHRVSVCRMRRLLSMELSSLCM